MPAGPGPEVGPPTGPPPRDTQETPPLVPLATSPSQHVPRAASPRAFDPATGDWLPSPAAQAWDPEAPKKSAGATAWHIVLGLDLGLLGLIVLMGIVLGVTEYLSPTGPAAFRPPSWQEIAIASGGAFVLMGVIPFLWVVGTRVGGLHGAIHYLKLERPAQSIVAGILWGLGCLAALILLALALDKLGYSPENPRVEALANSMTIPLALFVALCAGIGEEILFRGVLQRWLGVWGQAVLFGVAHADYGTPLQVVIPFALGLLFGYLVQGGARLWVPIAAHFTFNFAQLATAAYFT